MSTVVSEEPNRVASLNQNGESNNLKSDTIEELTKEVEALKKNSKKNELNSMMLHVI